MIWNVYLYDDGAVRWLGQVHEPDSPTAALDAFDKASKLHGFRNGLCVQREDIPAPDSNISRILAFPRTPEESMQREVMLRRASMITAQHMAKKKRKKAGGDYE